MRNLTADCRTRREIEGERAEFRENAAQVGRLIERGENGWARETLGGWFASLAAIHASFVTRDLTRPPRRREMSAHYHAAMSRQAARAAIFALDHGYRLEQRLAA